MKKQAQNSKGELVNINDVPSCIRDRDNYYCPITKEPLIPRKGPVKTHHFASKNPNNMSKWHIDWSNFVKNYGFDVEVSIKSGEKNRRLDSLLRDINLEFQHTTISSQEMVARTKDHQNSGYKPIWLLDATENTTYDSNKNYLYPTKWLCADFQDCHVFLDTLHGIVSVQSDLSKGIIVVNAFMDKDIFVDHIITGKIFSLEKHKPPIPKCTIIQANPGYGKTQSLCDELKTKNLLDEEKNNDYEIAIVLFPRHSQKDECVYKVDNLQDTSERKWKNSEREVSFLSRDADLCDGKQIVLEGYNDERLRFFGTIHSFTGCVYKKSFNTPCNSFEDMCDSIIKARGSSLLKSSLVTLRYGQNEIHCSKRILIICDEAQLMDVRFIFALFCIVEILPQVNIKIVGDILQSTDARYRADNIFSFRHHNEKELYNEWKNISFEYKQLPPVYRRGRNPKALELMNSRLSLFNKTYNLESMEFGGITECTDYVPPMMYKEESELIDKILNMVKILLDRDYTPKDFLFISPTINCELMSTLNTSLSNLFLQVFNDSSLVYMHSSEGGTRPIDISKSENKARIMSIQGSQGLGRENVFVIDLSNKKLMSLRTVPGDLKHSSLITVGLSRWIHQQFIFCPENDSLSEFIVNGRPLENSYTIYNSINFPDIVEIIKVPNADEYCKKDDIQNKKGNVDFSEHIGRHEIMTTLFVLQMYSHSNNDIRHQIHHYMKKITEYEIHIENDVKSFYGYRKKRENKNQPEKQFERQFEKDKKIWLLAYKELEASGKIINHDVEFMKICKIVQERLNNGELPFNENDEDCILPSFIFKYMVDYISWKHIDFALVMQNFIAIHNEEFNKDKFFSLCNLFKYNLNLIPSLTEAGWKNNYSRSLRLNSELKLNIFTRRSFGYNQDQGKICVYHIIPDINNLNIESEIAEDALCLWIVKNMLLNDSENEYELPKITSDDDLCVVLISINQSPITIPYSKLKKILQDNRDRIIKDCCDKLISNIPDFWKKYDEGKLNPDKCEGIWYIIFNRGKFKNKNKKLEQDTFEKYTAEEIIEQMEALFNFE